MLRVEGKVGIELRLKTILERKVHVQHRVEAALTL